MESAIAPELIPASILTLWAAGVAAGGAWVASRAIVGRGFDWLVGGTAAVLSASAGWAGAEWPAWIAAGACVAAVVVGGRRWPVAILLGGGAAASFVAASQLGSPLSAFTGSLALGGITAEMLLGHWFLVDPRLPRSALRALAAVGIGGTIFDAALGVTGLGGLALATVAGLGFLTAVLMVLVYLALRERGYAGVMAATGLSYLAVLTGLGAVAASRAAAIGVLPGLS